jgi:hypothetical protein
MSRYTITVTSDDHTDADATIGYDAPLRTFFLQAFPDESGDDLALWLGTSDREFETIDALHMAAFSRGYSFMPLPEDVALLLADDFAAEAGRLPHDGPLAGLLRHLRSR